MGKGRGLESEIIASLPHPVLVVGKDGFVLYANPAAYEFFMPVSRLEGSQLKGILTDLLFESVRRVLREAGGVFNVKDKVEMRGEKRHIVADIFPVDVGGQLGAAVLLRDVTQIRMLEQRDEKDRTSRVVEDLVRRIFSHIRPLVLGILNVCNYAEDSGSAGLEEIRLIREEALRLSHIAEEAVDFTLEVSDLRQGVNIYKVVEDALGMCKREILEKGLTIERDYLPGVPEVQGEPIELFKLFLQMVKNAVEASPEGGVLRIRISVDGAKKLVPGRFTLKVEFENEGKGVPEGLEESIFLPFVTTKVGHLGLGLAKAYKIVREHSGEIEYSRAGDRSVFTVFLPL